MAMQWQVAPIQLNSGINQKTDDKQVVPGQWLVLENLEMQKTGRFKKRRGFTKGTLWGAPGTTIVESAQNKAALYPNASTGDINFRWNQFISLGGASSLFKKQVSCVAHGTAGSVPYAMLHGNIDSSDVIAYYIKRYDSSGEITSNSYVMSANYSVYTKVVGLSDLQEPVFMLNKYNGTNNNLYIVRQGGSATNLITTAINGSYAHGATVSGNSNKIFIIFNDVTANVTRVYKYNYLTASIEASVSLTKDAVFTSVAVCPAVDGSRIWAAAGSTLYELNPSTLAVTATFAALSYGIKHITRDGDVLATGSAGTNNFRYQIAGSNLNLLDTFVGVISESQPVKLGDTYFAAIMQYGQNTVIGWPGGYGLTRLGTSFISPSFYPFSYGDQSETLGSSQPYQSSYATVTTGTAVLPISMRSGQTLVRFKDGQQSSGVKINGDTIYESMGLRMLVPSNGSVCPQSTALGFGYAPALPSLSSGGGGGSIPAGQYQIVAILKQKTSNGNIVYSGISPVYTNTSWTLNNILRITVTNVDWEKVKNVQQCFVDIYIKGPGETVFYSATGIYDLPFATSITQDVSVWPPTVPIALYTEGGVLEDLPPPATVGQLSLCKSRIFCFSAESPELRFSDEIYPGEIPGFNEAFALALIPDGGVGMIAKELDGKIFVFQKYCVSATFGDGPAANGNGGYPPLQVVARDIGTIVPGSVVTSNEGIYFLSSKGLWLINRGMTVEYIGAGIDDDAASIVCGAKLADTEQVWFFSSTKAMIWDSYHKLWTTAPTGLTGIVAAKVIDGALHVAANGYDYTLASTTTDDGTAITVRAKTGWISLAGLKNFERIRRIMFLCDQESSTTLTVKLRYNFVDTVVETFTVTSADLVDSGGNVQWLMRPKVQKCECFQLEFETSSSGATIELSSIALEYGIKSGLFRLPASKKIGGV